ncbi:OLC1v1009274C1 [Oldenlandia corymbosa var. corymbosa]|uniref:OLC1v1009274C1 n=1 Tax=Oldenlandia corymbosa var. corymbosa TaxID=529605 RepID=A0AAV1DNN1_OLDCO|nr:OLC1v1009274C1 [Oldenlandia corymbosa var. corymbosa]
MLVTKLDNKKSLLLEILRNVGDQYTDKYSEKSDDDLALTLYRSLKGNSYLIILDDIWDVEAWSNLRYSFPDDEYGSRIFLTSRDENVASQIEPHSQPPHSLRFLTSDESVELFRKKMSFLENSPSDVVAGAKAIAERCEGLPLMIVVIAGLLSNMEPCNWGEVEETLNKEGFVVNTGRDCIEDVAEGYMMELVHRNLVMVAGREPGGKMEFCILHYVLRDFCLEKGNKEHFLLHLHRHELGTSIEPSMLYRSLVLRSSRVEDFVEARPLCPRLRTLFLVADDKEMLQFVEPWYDILCKFCQSKFLRVLDLRGIYVFNFFPRAILLLAELRYLALYAGDDMEIPSSIERLSNLETFIVEGYGKLVVLLDTLLKMKRLRHMSSSRNNWKLKRKANPQHFRSLENLQILSGVTFSQFKKLNEVIRMFPNLRKLKCQVGTLGMIALDCLSRLESLSLHSFEWTGEDLDSQFRFPQNLKELTLSGHCLSWSKISAIHRLPKLEVLVLQRDAFARENWDMEEEEEGGTIFPNLRFLKLKQLDLARWTCESDETFPCLETLVLEDCRNLVELPSCLAQIPTLEMIEVIGCGQAVLDSIKQIQDAGNELLISPNCLRHTYIPPQAGCSSMMFIDFTASSDELDHALSEDHTTDSSYVPEEGTDEEY